MNLILSIATRNRIFAFNVIKVRHLFSLKSRQWLDCALFCNIIYNDVSQLLVIRFITPISIICKSVVRKLQKNCQKLTLCVVCCTRLYMVNSHLYLLSPSQPHIWGRTFCEGAAKSMCFSISRRGWKCPCWSLDWLFLWGWRQGRGKREGDKWFLKKISSREFILILLILSDKTKKKGMFSFLPAIVRWVKQTKLFQIQIILFKKRYRVPQKKLLTEFRGLCCIRS